MAYSGIYRPINPQKYRGNPRNVVYRSLWERKFMVYCDNHSHILEWGSETVIIPYHAPDGKIRRYYPDFYIKVREKGGGTAKYIIEIKPKKQTKPPKHNPKHKRRYLKEVKTFAINEAKWKAAEIVCEKRGWKWKILTEDTLNNTK